MTMQTITEQVSITPLNMDLAPCHASEAFYQLEKYYTPKQVHAITHYSGKYSYEIGKIVDVQPMVTVKEGWLTNMIMNECLASIR